MFPSVEVLKNIIRFLIDGSKLTKINPSAAITGINSPLCFLAKDGWSYEDSPVFVLTHPLGFTYMKSPYNMHALGVPCLYTSAILDNISMFVSYDGPIILSFIPYSAFISFIALSMVYSSMMSNTVYKYR